MSIQSYFFRHVRSVAGHHELFDWDRPLKNALATVLRPVNDLSHSLSIHVYYSPYSMFKFSVCLFVFILD